MTTYRSRHNHGDFFQMSKSVINDDSISWRAKGILAYIMSHANNWQVNLVDLVKHASEGYGAVRTALNELESAGYIVRKRFRVDAGKFEWIHEVYEDPVEESKRTSPEERKTGKRDADTTEEPLAKNQQMEPLARNPQVDYPHVETCHILLNNEIRNNEYMDDAENASSPATLPGLPAPTKKQTIPGEFLLTLANVCKINMSIASKPQKQQVGQSARILYLKAGARSTDLTAFSSWWYANDWRGKKGQAPTPAQVRECWEQFRTKRVAQPYGMAVVQM